MLDGLRRPSAPWGFLLNDEQVVFRGGPPSKAGPVSRPDRRPSAPIGPVWVGVMEPYGSPPANSHRLSICIYKVEVVGVVGCSHTPEESADKYNLQASPLPPTPRNSMIFSDFH